MVLQPEGMECGVAMIRGGYNRESSERHDACINGQVAFDVEHSSMQGLKKREKLHIFFDNSRLSARNLSNHSKTFYIICQIWQICQISLTVVRVWRCNLPERGTPLFKFKTQKYEKNSSPLNDEPEILFAFGNYFLTNVFNLSRDHGVG